MALDKEFLINLGVEKSVANDIMNEHGEVVSYWKAEVKKYKDEAKQYKNDAEKVPDLEAENKKLKDEAAKDNPFEKKYNDLKAEHEKFKADITAEKTKAAQAAAVKAYFTEKHIVGNNLEIALMAASGITNDVEVEDGKIKDTAKLDELISGKLSALVSKDVNVGANVPNPPDGKGADDIRKPSRAAELAAAYHSNLYGSNGNSEKKGE